MQEQRVDENGFYLKDTNGVDYSLTTAEIQDLLQTKTKAEVIADIEQQIEDTFPIAYPSHRVTVDINSDGTPKNLELRNYG